jgi:hypothetical protein
MIESRLTIEIEKEELGGPYVTRESHDITGVRRIM